ncbi:MAG: hypothetical protein IKV64_00480 [Clostridia bacterium]|nr:hypothetical protein [Clostridia bacterium]
MANNMMKSFNRQKKAEQERLLASASVEIYFQLFIIALNRSFGFGKIRLNRLLKAVKDVEVQFLDDAKRNKHDRNFSTIEYSKAVLDKEVFNILGEGINFR